MAINDFITSTLNLETSQIDTFDCVRDNGVLKMFISLKNQFPCCPFCGGKSTGNGSRTRVYNHLPMAGTPSLIIWNRKRYLCKDCGKSFMELNPFGSEAFHHTYIVFRNPY